MYYFDKDAAKWRLVFFLEDVPVTPEQRRDAAKPAPQYMDYIVDADTGKVVAELPRTPSMATTVEQAIDGRKQSRQIKMENSGAKRILQDTSVNVQTFDFKFDDPQVNEVGLPGTAIRRPPEPCRLQLLARMRMLSPWQNFCEMSYAVTISITRAVQ